MEESAFDSMFSKPLRYFVEYMVASGKADVKKSLLIAGYAQR